MKNRVLSSMIGAAILMSGLQVSRAEETVTLSKMHLCCGACVKAVEGALEKVEGAKVKVDADGGKAVVTAPDAKTARQAVSAIARAGFHGESDHAKIKSPDNSGIKEGKVSKLELTGVHNCCGGCNKAIKAALATVPGVEKDDAAPKSKTLVVEGDFDGLAVITALNKAGFHVVSKEAAAERAKGGQKKNKKAGKKATEKS